MKEFIHGGATVILVSHNLDVVKGHCGKVYLLDRGEIVKMGSAEEVVNHYLSLNKAK